MLTPEQTAHVLRLLGSPVVSSQTAEGGFSPATRERVVLEDGRRAFVKAATGPMTSAWLRDEWRIYGAVEAPFIPRVLAWDPTVAVLILEDLGDCERAPPWTSDAISAVLRSLDALAGLEPPAALTPITPDGWDGWAKTASDPGRLAPFGVECGWLDRALPALVRAEAAVRLGGESVVHLDLRGDNLFLRDGWAVIVDWNWAGIGNPLLDRAFWAPSLQLDGGPAPESIVGDQPELAAVVSGFFAWRTPEPVELASQRIRDFQLAQLEVALPWAARALGLPAPF